MEERKIQIKVTEQENKVIEMMRQIEFGEVRIVIANSRPVRIEEIRKAIQL